MERLASRLKARSSRAARCAGTLPRMADEQALAAVRNWRFRPARFDGRKAACRIVLAIDFSLL